MRQILRFRRPSPAMLVALVALFIALGGPAQASHLIDGAFIRKGTITGRQIKAHSVSKTDLTKATVKALTATPAHSVRSAQIADGQVLARHLATGSVGTAAIADGSVGSADLAMGSVGASKLAANSVGGASVANGSLQTVDIGSFAGAVQVDFSSFDTGTSNQCQASTAVPATPTGGQPNIADDVVAVSPPADWPDTVAVSGKAGPGNTIRIIACFTGVGTTPDPPSTIFRYVTFDSP
jgi:hypothetical protein